MLEDSQLAMLIHQMPENTESFIALLRDAGPSPVKSAAPSFDLNDFENFNFSGSQVDEGFQADVFAFNHWQGDKQAQAETQAIPNIHYTSSIPNYDTNLNSSDYPSSAGIRASEVNPPGVTDDHNFFQPNTVVNTLQPIIPTKSTTSPRKRNAKGKLACMARGCTKFVLAPKCGSQMCKGHCIANRPNGLGCQEHGKGSNCGQSLENSTSISLLPSNDWALSRPVPNIPLQPLPSSATNATAVSPSRTGSQFNKSYRTEMLPAHEASWRQKKQAQHEALESKSLKAEYERRYQNQVVVIFWNKVCNLSLVYLFGTYAHYILG